MRKGEILLLLHAHLPYVRHPEHERFLEENWLYEAMAETYVPLVDMLGRLADEGVRYKITLSISPTLCAMLGDALLRKRFIRRLQRTAELADKEVLRTKKDARLNSLALMYRRQAGRVLKAYEKYHGNLTGELKKLSDEGFIELITTSATHAYLPNLASSPDAVRTQISIGLQSHSLEFSAASQGVWLPECGYYEGLDELAMESGAGFFFLESHGLLNARPRARFGVYKPVRTQAGAVAFARDPASSEQVWSAQGGYPGDPDYRDFYRDIGFDLPIEYIRPYVQPGGQREATGIKYHRITGRTERKKIYDEHKALNKARIHAGDFVLKKQLEVSHLCGAYGFAPLIVAPFDAELFGHWWHEGISWLEFVLRGLASQSTVGMTTPSEYIDLNPDLQGASPSPSSWGRGGYGMTWCGEKNSWAIRHIHASALTMAELRDGYLNKSDNLTKRALNQALRELLIMQASDWLFMMQEGTSPHYAEERLLLHIKAFGRLCRMIREGKINKDYVERAESKNGIFPFADYRDYGRSFS